VGTVHNWQTFFNRVFHLFVILILFYIWFFDYNIWSWEFKNTDFLLLIFSTLALYVTYPLRRNAYANEKVSVLQPFAMLYQVFPIIIWFIFIATERANLITFLTAILASLVVIGVNIDYKNFKMNKYSLMVLTSSVIKSFQIFAIVYLLTKVNPASLYFTESIIVIVLAIILILSKRELGEIRLINKKYALLLTLSNSAFIISILLSLTMISTLGIVLTSLLSLLYLSFVYILWYILLKEIPSKKDILVSIFVAICIIIGVLFKN